MTATVRIKTTRGCVIGAGRSLGADELATVDALTAATLLAQGAAVLVRPGDQAALRQALLADMREQHGGRIGKPPTGSPWQPMPPLH